MLDGVGVQHAAGGAVCSRPGGGDDAGPQPTHGLHQLPAAEARRRHRQHTGPWQQPGSSLQSCYFIYVFVDVIFVCLLCTRPLIGGGIK